MIPTTVDVIDTIDAYMASGPSHIVVDERMSEGFLRILTGDWSITHKFFNSKLFSDALENGCDKTCVRNRSRITFARIANNITSKKLFKSLMQIIGKFDTCTEHNSIMFETVENFENTNSPDVKGKLCSKIYYIDNNNEYHLAIPGDLINKNDLALGKFLKAHERFDINCKFGNPICSPRTLKTELSPEISCLEDGNIMLKKT